MKPIGVVVAGAVVDAQKVVSRGRYTTTESLQIQYRFVASNGRTSEARAEGLFENATDSAAPVVGTPMRVWYIDEEKHYLL